MRDIEVRKDPSPAAERSSRVRVLITDGAKGLGLVFREALGAQGHQLVISGRDQTALATADDEFGNKTHVGDPFATPKLIERLGGTNVLVSNGVLARSQCDAGRFTPVEQPADLLARIVSGEFDHRSGELITAQDG